MTVPVSLTGKYQLVVLGQEGSPRVAEQAGRLAGAVSAAFDRLGVNPKKFLVVVPQDRPVDKKMPVIGVFLGLVPSPELSPAASDRLRELLEDGALVIPVVDDLAGFGTSVVPELAGLNGCTLADCGGDLERLAARVLEGFGLLRERRRLFISYRRVVSSGVATQLYEALDAAGFDVFLDTQGALRPGEPFQEVLWHRLADTDVTVLLDTQEFLASRWTEEELARANTANIQILQVLWPGQVEASTAAFSTFHPLTPDDFAGPDTLGPGAQLKDVEVSAIVDGVEGLRARAFGARHAFLVREFALEVRASGMELRTTLERNLVVTGPDGVKVLVMPAIGVPDAERYEALQRLGQRDLAEGRSYARPPVLLYDQTGIQSRWLRHLGWLNENLSCARSVGIVDVRDWLTELREGTA